MAKDMQRLSHNQKIQRIAKNNDRTGHGVLTKFPPRDMNAWKKEGRKGKKRRR
jgi:hypothetical protein